MAPLLIDTHALLWWLSNDHRLTKCARAAIAAPETTVLVSAVSAWEISIKQQFGKLSAPDDLIDATESSGFAWLPIEAEDGYRAGRLPMHHRDPFDRLLIAQALARNVALVSRDETFDLYGVARMWS